MPNSAGDIPNLPQSWPIVVKDVNAMTTNSAVKYRGRLFSKVDAVDMAMIDYQREVTVPCWQEGLRVLGLIMTTGQSQPSRA